MPEADPPLAGSPPSSSYFKRLNNYINFTGSVGVPSQAGHKVPRYLVILLTRQIITPG